MIEFDFQRSSFIVDGVVVGPATVPDHLRSRAELTVGGIVGQPGWIKAEGELDRTGVELAFKNGRFRGAILWCRIREASDWDDFARAESDRLRAHRALLLRLFGSDSFEDATVVVYLAPEPKNLMQLIYLDPKG